MKNLIKTLFDSRQSRKEASPLSATEKSLLRDAFWQFLDAHPLPVVASAAPEHSLFSFWRRLTTYAVPQTALVVFCAMSGVAYMAEYAAPGDALYAIKRNVNEQLLLRASAFSPELRAHVDSTLLARRLSEVEYVASNNRWHRASEDALRTDIDMRTHALHGYIAEIEAAGELDEAIATGTKLDTLLDTHNSKLYHLWTARGNAEHRADIEAFIRLIEAERGELQKLREKLFTVNADESHESVRVDLQKPTEELIEVLDTWQEKRTAHKDVLSEEAYDTSGTLLENAEDALAKARASNNTERALKSLKTAATALEEAAALLNF